MHPSSHLLIRCGIQVQPVPTDWLLCFLHTSITGILTLHLTLLHYVKSKPRWQDISIATPPPPSSLPLSGLLLLIGSHVLHIFMQRNPSLKNLSWFIFHHTRLGRVAFTRTAIIHWHGKTLKLVSKWRWKWAVLTMASFSFSFSVSSVPESCSATTLPLCTNTHTLRTCQPQTLAIRQQAKQLNRYIWFSSRYWPELSMFYISPAIYKSMEMTAFSGPTILLSKTWRYKQSGHIIVVQQAKDGSPKMNIWLRHRG